MVAAAEGDAGDAVASAARRRRARSGSRAKRKGEMELDPGRAGVSEAEYFVESCRAAGQMELGLREMKGRAREAEGECGARLCLLEAVDRLNVLDDETAFRFPALTGHEQMLRSAVAAAEGRAWHKLSAQFLQGGVPRHHVARNGATVRVSARCDARKTLRQLSEGDKVRVAEVAGNWARVTHPLKGWVWRTNLTPVGDELSGDAEAAAAETELPEEEDPWDGTPAASSLPPSWSSVELTPGNCGSFALSNRISQSAPSSSRSSRDPHQSPRCRASPEPPRASEGRGDGGHDDAPKLPPPHTVTRHPGWVYQLSPACPPGAAPSAAAAAALPPSPKPLPPSDSPAVELPPPAVAPDEAAYACGESSCGGVLSPLQSLPAVSPHPLQQTPRPATSPRPPQPTGNLTAPLAAAAAAAAEDEVRQPRHRQRMPITPRPDPLSALSLCDGEVVEVRDSESSPFRRGRVARVQNGRVLVRLDGFIGMTQWAQIRRCDFSIFAGDGRLAAVHRAGAFPVAPDADYGPPPRNMFRDDVCCRLQQVWVRRGQSGDALGLTVVDDRLFVHRVDPGLPAARAGVVPGMQVVAVGNSAVRCLYDLKKALRGETPDFILTVAAPPGGGNPPVALPPAARPAAPPPAPASTPRSSTEEAVHQPTSC